MKKFFTLLALSCVGMGAWAQTVVAHMSDLVSAGTNNGATVNTQWKASEGSVYEFSDNHFIGGITNDAIKEALGSKYVTVAAWVYGRPTGGCIFGYGGGGDGIKFKLTGTTMQTTTKGKCDYPTQADNVIADNQWNLVAFTINPAYSQTRYISGHQGHFGYFYTKNAGTSGVVATAEANQFFAVGSGNQGEAREAFTGLLANVTVITSDSWLGSANSVADLVGAAPVINEENYSLVTYNFTATNSGNYPISWTETAIVENGEEASVDGVSYDFFSDFAITEADKTVSATNKTFTVTANHTLPMVPGKFYHVKYGDNLYLSYVDNNNVNIKAPKDGSDAKNVWFVKQVSTQDAPFFSLCNVSSLKAAHAKNDQNNACEAINEFAYEFVKAGSAFRIFEPNTTFNVGAHGKYPTNVANSGLGRWNTNNRNSGTTYTVEEFDESVLNFNQGQEGYVGYCSDVTPFTSAKTAYTGEKSAANLKAALEAKAGLARIELEEGKYYQITFNRGNQAFGNYGVWADPEGNVSTEVASRTVTTADYATASVPAGLWQFEPAANGQYLKTVGSGFYLANVNSGHLVTTKEKGDAKTFALANGNNNFTTWQMTENGKTGNATINIYYNPGQNTSREVTYWQANDAGDYFTIKEVTEIPLTIKTSKWASACYPVAVTLPAELTAYYAVKASSEGIGLDPVEGKVVPANTPVVITGEAGNYNLTIGGEADEIEGNLFTGTTVARQGYNESEGYRYGLSNGNFARITGTSIAANKAFIESENDLAAAGSTLRVYIFEDTLTGIDAVETPAEQGAYFDLNGRMVAYPTTGVYVRNGKKIFVK